MVYGICFCPETREKELKSIGCADSKTLTEEQRDKLFEKLNSYNDFVGWAVEIIAPNKICNSMFKRVKHSLNEVSHDSAIGLIRKALSLNVNVTSVFVDTVGPPEKYQAKLSALFPGIKITVSKKADSIYPVVSAASICAKVSRDNALKDWNFREPSFKALFQDEKQLSWGSGYPADPTTKKFLAENVDPIFGFPQLVRFSWSTVGLILKTKGVKVEWEEDEEQNNSQKSVQNFFVKKSEGPMRKHPYFNHRKIKPAVKLL